MIIRLLVSEIGVARELICVFAVHASQSAKRVSKRKPSVFSIPALRLGL